MNTIVIILCFISLVSLGALHILSPEYKPSWRMISEYALGKYKWLLTAFFYSWGIASLILAFLLWKYIDGFWAIMGCVLLFLSGIGAFLGGLFDIKHKNHGLAFALGVPTLPIGALILTYHLIKHDHWSGNQSSILISAHSTWISFVLMGASMIVLMNGYKKTGLPMGPGVEPPTVLPKGVIGINGYFNRLLVICYILWLVVIALSMP